MPKVKRIGILTAGGDIPDQVAGHRKTVPADHAWVAAARHIGTCIGD